MKNKIPMLWIYSRIKIKSKHLQSKNSFKMSMRNIQKMKLLEQKLRGVDKEMVFQTIGRALRVIFI